MITFRPLKVPRFLTINQHTAPNQDTPPGLSFR